MIKAKISVDSSELNQGLNNAKTAVKSTGREIESGSGALDAFGDSADNAVRALDSVGGALGQASTGFSGIAGDIVALCKNPIAMLIAALGVLIAVGVHTWEKLTESAEEYSERMAKQAEYAKEKTDQITKEQKAENEYIETLKRLARQEKLSNLEKNIATSLIAELTKKYGDLGITIDATTGKISGLDTAIRGLHKKQRDEEIKAYEAEVKVAARRAHVKASQMTLHLGMTKSSGGSHTYSREGEVAQQYRHISEARNMGYDVKLNVRDKRKWSKTGNYAGSSGERDADPEQLRLNRLWNEGGLEGKLEFAQGMQAVVAGDTEQVEMYQELAKLLQDLIEKRKALANVEKYGFNDASEWLSATNEVIDKTAEESAKTVAKNEALAKKLNDQKQAELYAQLETNAERILFKEKELAAVKAEIAKRNKKIAEEEEKLDKNAEQVEEASKITDKFEKNKRLYDLAVEEHEIRSRINAQYELLNQDTAEQITIEKQISDLHKQSKDFYKNNVDSLDEEIQLLQLKLNGKDEEITKQMLLNELKAKGLKLEQDEIDKILEKKGELGSLKLQDNLNEEIEDLTLKRDLAKGDMSEEEYARAEAILNAEKAKGGKLTADELKKLDEVLALKKEIAKLEKKEQEDKEWDIEYDRRIQIEKQHATALENDVQKLRQRYEADDVSLLSKRDYIKQEIEKALEASGNSVLDSDARRRIRKAAGEKWELENATRALEKRKKEGKNGIDAVGELTNDLARRGGFAGSVARDPLKQINMQILQVEKIQQITLENIKDEISRLGVVK